MIPNIFISSTIEDLHYLRDGIREVIQEIGYNPILSEYGDVGYIPHLSVVDSCYSSVHDCQLAILIIGKQYGNITTSGKSVTHSEFLEAKKLRKPIYTLVHKEVLSFKKVYDTNEQSEVNFPGMDQPTKTFGFIDEIINYDINNAILSFQNSDEAKQLIKKQLAELFFTLLTQRFIHLEDRIIEIQSEIETIRSKVWESEEETAWQNVTARKFLLAPRNDILNFLLETLCGSVEHGLQEMLKFPSFDKFLSNIQITLTEIEDWLSYRKDHSKSPHSEFFIASWEIDEEENKSGFWSFNESAKELVVNKEAYQLFKIKFKEFEKLVLGS